MKHLLRYSEQWRSGGAPGVYTTRIGVNHDAEAAWTELSRQPWVASATVTGGYLTITVTPSALEHVALDVAETGGDYARSDVLRGTSIRAAPSALLATAHTWEDAHRALAAELSMNLAATAGATVQVTTQTTTQPTTEGQVAAAIAYAGEDMVRFWLARTPPGHAGKPPGRAGKPPGRTDPTWLARHSLGNPAYAVLYAHAAAAAVLRWAGSPPGEFRPGRLAEPGELLLLDALSWLPERVATAARRGRPDLFARYVELLASRTIDIISTRNFAPGPETGPESTSRGRDERLWLAWAAQAGLAAGLGLLGIAARERI